MNWTGKADSPEKLGAEVHVSKISNVTDDVDVVDSSKLI
jgi:hypothetical protein